ncbi:MAG: histidine phosphatase family protein [Polyangiaceae bacterium]
MSTLYLVRHGQASFHAEDYDQLSDLGIRQSRVLGEDCALRGLKMDAVYTGPRRRQRDTYQHMREAAREAGHQLPEPQLIEAFDEIDIQAVTDQAMARVLPSCPDLPEQIRKQELTDAGREAMRHYGGIVRALLKRWAAQDLDFIETFDAFYARVSAALSQVMRDQGRGKNVAVITSGGPVCMAVRLALALEPAATVDLMWIVHNASITRFKFTEDRFTLMGFNGIGHLREAELLTHV